MDIIKLLNYGVWQKKEEVLLYFGKDLKEEPDFNCAVAEVFDMRRPACYRGSIIRGFGESFIISTIYY